MKYKAQNEYRLFIINLFSLAPERAPWALE